MALTHRVERIQEQVREEVSQMLATEVRDPGVGLVTVTRAKVTGELSLARVYWTIIGDAAERKKTQKALERAGGFVRHLLAERLSLRRAPEVKFIYDESVAAQDRIEQIIQEIHADLLKCVAGFLQVIAVGHHPVESFHFLEQCRVVAKNFHLDL